MDFPPTDLMDEGACFQRLVDWLHPGGLACPRCAGREHPAVHRRHREPVIDYRCPSCRRVFNAFTGTLLQGTRRRPAELVLVLRGIAQAVPTARLARELGRDRKELLALRHRLQHAALRFRDRRRLGDAVVEADEMFQNVGEKGRPHADPADPPRRRANKARGHGSWDSDRPPVCGVVGRDGGEARLSVERHTDAVTLNRIRRIGARGDAWTTATVPSPLTPGQVRAEVISPLGRGRPAVIGTRQGSCPICQDSREPISRIHRPPWPPHTVWTIARMPARMASGNSGQRSMTRARSGGRPG